MTALTEQDRIELIRLLQAGEQIPARWLGKLFPGGPQSVEIGKEYRLEYAGKMKREQVLAETPAAPWQLVRRLLVLCKIVQYEQNRVNNLAPLRMLGDTIRVSALDFNICLQIYRQRKKPAFAGFAV